MTVSRHLRIWSIATAVATVLLLALGTLVTSFRVGMADPIWPTAPWRLAFIDWTEPSRGFLIEHSHRLAGYTVGALMSVLAVWVWMTEPRRGLKWAGVGAILAWLAAFGSLHGVLIKQIKEVGPGVQLQLPPTILGALVVAGGALLLVAAADAVVGSPGWRVRLLGMALLLGVCVQGLLGGLRVYLNALYAEQYSVVHASFSQVVFGLALAIAVTLNGSADRRATWFGLVVVALLFTQIVFGAILRHTLSPAGPRVHLLLALVAGYGVIALARQSWGASKLWATAAVALLLVQVALGAEAWFARFAGGFETSLMRRVTEADALLRTSHTLVGYLLFGASIVLALRGKAGAGRPAAIETPLLEGVA